ncbi:3-methyladenine DNA glycosylase [Microbacterium sp. ET2]|uniref:3-methyladenine DNA glycosylase n=1 Tax=Microbacterium albipurpureum TaxID=3050384 RepID=UPI00259CFB3F|nr:3-methyladenine DNA glycosylase [Microbacterium sp. ET2 (Ac-2212)]WJL95689.1 3-methyladenine DNA glycosylase [Microbacterium sp. ET2 (Ac-2212)]
MRLERAEWTTRERSHRERADSLTAAHRERARRGEKHPVEDFLFTYYSYKPALLSRWHPGAGVELTGAASEPRAGWRWYEPGTHPGSLRVDDVGFRRSRAGILRGIQGLLRSTQERAPVFGCFGLHEWAMLYRSPERRHALALRLGPRGTDDVVEAHELRCTHFDAFRFFTPDAAPRNRTPLERASQSAFEQPGCLHAGMDLYKWAMKAGPLVPGELLLDCFALARDVRALDMAASPYDLSDWGYEAVAIETPSGKAEYVGRQRDFSDRAQRLRTRLRDVLRTGDQETGSHEGHGDMPGPSAASSSRASATRDAASLSRCSES